MSSESVCAVNWQPARVAGTDPEYQVFSIATAVTAVSTSIWGGYPLDAGGLRTPPGKVWMELEALTFNAWVRCSRTATTGTDSSNGALVVVGVPRLFYLDPTKDIFWDHIGANVGTLKWRRVGPIGERIRA